MNKPLNRKRGSIVPSNTQLERALFLFKQNKFSEALRLLTKVYKKEPNNVNALMAASICCRELAKNDAALRLINRVIQIAPDFEEALLQRGITFFQSGKLDECIENLDRVLSKQKRHSEALTWKGLALVKKDLPHDALRVFDAVIDAEPKKSGGFTNRGLLKLQLGNASESINDFDQALIISPNSPKLLMMRAQAYHTMGEFGRAVDDLTEVHSLDPKSVLPLQRRGLTYLKLEEFEKALWDFNSALKIEPNSKIDLLNKANALSQLRRYNEAMDVLNLSIGLDNRYANAYNNRGRVYQAMGLYTEALDDFNKATQLNENFAEASSNKSLLLLLLGKFKSGWQAYESRLLLNNQKLPIKKFADRLPIWQGEKGKKVLIWGEQGLGDEIMFASLLPDIARISKKISIICDDRLLKIYNRSFPKDITFFTETSLPDFIEFNCQLSLGSLGKFFRNELTDFNQNKQPFLLADESIKAKYKRYFEKENKLLIGVSWQSEATLNADQKSLELNKILEQLRAFNVQFVSLQYGDVSAEIEDPSLKEYPIDFLPDVDKKNDIEELFGIVASCDRVVTTSNVTAHIAGALGVPTTVLVNNQANWRWHNEWQSSYWYSSVKILRACASGDWTIALKKLSKIWD